MLLGIGYGGIFSVLFSSKKAAFSEIYMQSLLGVYVLLFILCYLKSYVLKINK